MPLGAVVEELVDSEPVVDPDPPVESELSLVPEPPLLVVFVVPAEDVLLLLPATPVESPLSPQSNTTAITTRATITNAAIPNARRRLAAAFRLRLDDV